MHTIRLKRTESIYDLFAISLTTDGIGTRKKKIEILTKVKKIILQNNDLGDQFEARIREARKGGDYLLPRMCDYLVVDSLYYVPPENKSKWMFCQTTKIEEVLSLQMKASRSKPLSGQSASEICGLVQGCLVFVVPEENIISKKLDYTNDPNNAGPTEWSQYRIVLSEEEPWPSLCNTIHEHTHSTSTRN